MPISRSIKRPLWRLYGRVVPLKLQYLIRVVRGKGNYGYCPICEKRVFFVVDGDWLRDRYRCTGCRSMPRWRALMHVLDTQFPNWRELAIHECSPDGVISAKVKQECPGYVGSQYWPDVRGGTVHDGVRCEDLQRQTFGDGTFDLVITQDVFEHLFDPAAALREIERTLKPGGAHLFTVPMYQRPKTVVRAERRPDGTINHLLPPDYHGNPVDDKGSLVVREWGRDLLEFINRSCRLQTTVYVIRDRALGLDGEFLEVFVSRKENL